MLDIKFIRENKELVAKTIEEKGVKLDLAELLKLDAERRALIQKVEAAREQRNKLSDQVAREKDQVKREQLIAEVKGGKEEMARREEQLAAVQKRYEELLLLTPNIPAADAPRGLDAAANAEIYRWGKVPEFPFPIKDHVQLGEELGLLDLINGARVSGYRGYYLKNEAVLMHLGLVWLALQKLNDRGYQLMVPPTIVKAFSLVGSGHWPTGKEETFQLTNPGKDGAENTGDQLYLAGTAEVPLLAWASGRVFNLDDLPLKLGGVSQCYRSEIGSYGKDTKGIYRIHEFLKVEQVVICQADLAESEKWFKEMLAVSQEMLEDLKLPYRIVANSTGDMGAGKYRMTDVETWMPSRNGYGETHSNSNLTDWQSRRSNIRYQDKDGVIKYAYTLNDTVIASPRILIALWENYQQADGSILVPKVLRPYVGKKVIKPRYGGG